jgi:tripartite ATP-independent transporter DctP family solute receptor
MGHMDKKAASFLALGLVLGVVLSSAAFSVLMRPEAAGSGQSTGVAAPRVLKLAHVLDQSHPVHVAMDFMAKDLEKRSGGRMRLEIFPNGQLGSETDSIEQVQRGALAMVKTSAASLEGFIPEMAVFGLPYLFRDGEHYWAVLEGEIGQELLTAGSSVGVRGLCYYDSGARSFYTRDAPVLSPADLHGLKIRVLRSKTAMDTISVMGGAPTPIPWGELYTALQQGMVDGAENNAPSFQTSRHYEVAKQYSLDEHTRVPDIVLFSQAVWDSLTPEQQRWVNEAAAESVRFQRELWKEKTEEALVALKKAGVTIHRPPKEPFVESVAPLYEKLKGTKLEKWVERIRAVK